MRRRKLGKFRKFFPKGFSRCIRKHFESVKIISMISEQLVLKKLGIVMPISIQALSQEAYK